MKWKKSFIFALFLLTSCITVNLGEHKPTDKVPELIKPLEPTKVYIAPVKDGNTQQVTLVSGKKLTYTLPEGWKSVDLGLANKVAMGPLIDYVSVNVVFTSEITNLKLVEYADIAAQTASKIFPSWKHLISVECSPIGGRECFSVAAENEIDGLKMYQTMLLVKLEDEIVVITQTFPRSNLMEIFEVLNEVTDSIEFR